MQTFRGVFLIAIIGCALCIIVAFYYCVRDCISINKNNRIELSSWGQSSRDCFSRFPKFELICIAFLMIAPIVTIHYYTSVLSPGTYCFSAIVESNGESYILPSQIRVLSCDDEDGQGRRTMFLDRLYWANGGYSEFGESELEFDKQINAKDYNNKSYKITLTKDRALCLAFDEDIEPKSAVDLWIMGAVSLCAIALLLPKYLNKSTP